ncbi:nose resistant to fluoxetine protein 6-like [Glossina fuscipes]|uniref:Nose resistant to fluoxetine protein 6-like n=1 Tax=Glossina fuscipes TaxID=7396 RepID=A0A9C6DRU3_9MUSC|nr:nose resistant to fluoxetine protein 6-like [Glossina fuscipes]
MESIAAFVCLLFTLFGSSLSRLSTVQERLVERNFLFGIASLAAYNENATTQCGKELEILIKAASERQLWSSKLLDAFGSPPQQFLWGNYLWFGTPALCYDLNQPMDISLALSQPIVTNVTSPFPLEYTVVYLNFSTPFYIDVKLAYENYIHLGLCLPRSCNMDVIRKATDQYFEKDNAKFETQRTFQLELKTVAIKTPHFSWRFLTQTGSILLLLRLLDTLFTVISLKIFAEIIYKSKENRRLQLFLPYQSGNMPAFPQTEKSPFWIELILCFRFEDNYEAIMNFDSDNGRSSKILTSLAGMRTIICLWVTVFHVYYYSFNFISNIMVVMARLEDFAVQPVSQAVFYVDVFFTISSFLLVYNFLMDGKQMENILKNNFWHNIKIFARLIVQRYIRLTPVLIVAMIFGNWLYDLISVYSPFYMGKHNAIYCKKNWWYNLLYIQNFLDMNNICCSWTWYLACEMQYFLMFTGLLFVYVKQPNIAKVMFVVLTFVSLVIAWWLHYSNGIKFQIDVINSTLNQLYVKPWLRVFPYIGGATMGWVMHYLQQRKHLNSAQCSQCDKLQQQQQQQHQQQQHQRKKNFFFKEPRKWFSYVYLTFWLFLAVFYLLTNFMSYWRTMPTWLLGTIMTVGKLAFSLCIGVVIIMCASGRGGRLNAFLSARPFLFLNKFCFSIYLMAPVIVMGIFGLRNAPTNYTDVSSGADFFATIILALMSGFLVLLLLELPTQKMAILMRRHFNT